jgi:hypothetical protein
LALRRLGELRAGPGQRPTGENEDAVHALTVRTASAGEQWPECHLSL